MKTLFFTLVTLLLLSFQFHQEHKESQPSIYVGAVLNDTSSLVNEATAYRSELLNSEHPIEIWFESNPVFGNADRYILFYDSCWMIKYPVMNVHKSKAGKVFPLKTAQLKLIERLTANHIFSLPGEHEIAGNHFNINTAKFEGFDMKSFDGICYSISYKVGDRYRAYSFCNPQRPNLGVGKASPYAEYNAIAEVFKSLGRD